MGQIILNIMINSKLDYANTLMDNMDINSRSKTTVKVKRIQLKLIYKLIIM